LTKNNKYSPGLKIGLDASNLLLGGGVTHIVEILRELAPKEKAIAKVIVWGNQGILNVLEDRPWLHKVCPPEINYGRFLRIYWQKYKLPKLVEASGCDILFAPGGSHFGNFHPVVTISQNLLPFDFKELFRYGFSKMTFRLLLLRWLQLRSMQNADGVIFLTQYSKSKIMKSLKNYQKNTIIISHGINTRFCMKPKVQKSISEYSYDNPFRLIYVSSVDQYKHQWNVVKAVSQLRQEGFPLQLDLVGPSYPPALLRLKKSIKYSPFAVDCVSYHGEVPYEELHRKYEQADLGIFASSCESFSINLLESIAACLPMACSENEPMPEILKRGGVYFNPEEPKDIALAVRSLIISTKLREEKAQFSFKLVQGFSWKTCSNQTFTFISEIAKNFK
jgi:glycosyltransferase involved in cell wall biosynthesis